MMPERSSLTDFVVPLGLPDLPVPVGFWGRYRLMCQGDLTTMTIQVAQRIGTGIASRTRLTVPPAD